jgi:hypothetical protein
VSAVRVAGPEAFSRALRVVLELLDEGKASGVSAVYDPTGIGRVAVTTVDGKDVPLPGVPEDEETTPPETPQAKASRLDPPEPKL